MTQPSNNHKAIELARLEHVYGPLTIENRLELAKWVARHLEHIGPKRLAELLMESIASDNNRTHPLVQATMFGETEGETK